MYAYFKKQTDEIPQEKTWTWLRKGKMQERNCISLIAMQNNVIRFIYIEAKTDNMRNNSKYGLSGEKNETVNHISGCSKRAQISSRPSVTAWKS